MKAAVPRLRTSSTRPASSRMSAATTLIVRSLTVVLARKQAELAGVALRLGKAEVFERRTCEQAAARRALQEALLDQVRLDDVLERVARLRQRRGDRVDADRAAAIVERDGREIAPVHRVEAARIDFQRRERAVGNLAVDGRRAFGVGEVAHAAQEPSGNARRAASAPRNLVG